MINWLINRAKRTPYFHLTDYMNRFWLVPYNEVILREVGLVPKPDGSGTWRKISTDGTGPVTWRRPLARLIQKMGIAIRVHEILRSDEGRDPHDHPWPYLTVILKGGYFESRYDEHGNRLSTKWHGPGSVLWRPAGSWHRLDVPNGMVATTLFITGKKACTWGFLVNGHKVPHNEYNRRDA